MKFCLGIVHFGEINLRNRKAPSFRNSQFRPAAARRSRTIVVWLGQKPGYRGDLRRGRQCGTVLQLDNPLIAHLNVLT